METYLPVIWAGVIGTAVALYVILDGFDLGTGILFPFAKTERERDQMMDSVAPFWDGNETWLVLGGGGLWVAFPRAYAVIMPALYLPVFVMLLALVFRGVAFEFRSVAVTSKGYAFMAVVSIWTPLAFDRIAARWFSAPNIYFLWPVPLLTALTALMAWRSLEERREILPFFASIVLFLLGYLGLVISTFPYLVPPTLTLWQTAAAPASQLFMLTGTLILLPIILGYIVFVYWIFRGKVREGEGYH